MPFDILPGSDRPRIILPKIDYPRIPYAEYARNMLLAQQFRNKMILDSMDKVLNAADPLTMAQRKYAMMKVQQEEKMMPLEYETAQLKGEQLRTELDWRKEQAARWRKNMDMADAATGDGEQVKGQPSYAPPEAVTYPVGTGVGGGGAKAIGGTSPAGAQPTGMLDVAARKAGYPQADISIAGPTTPTIPGSYIMRPSWMPQEGDEDKSPAEVAQAAANVSTPDWRTFYDNTQQ